MGKSIESDTFFNIRKIEKERKQITILSINRLTGNYFHVILMIGRRMFRW